MISEYFLSDSRRCTSLAAGMQCDIGIQDYLSDCDYIAVHGTSEKVLATFSGGLACTTGHQARTTLRASARVVSCKVSRALRNEPLR